MPFWPFTGHEVAELAQIKLTPAQLRSLEAAAKRKGKEYFYPQERIKRAKRETAAAAQKKPTAAEAAQGGNFRARKEQTDRDVLDALAQLRKQAGRTVK